MTDLSPPETVEFFFDPMCPWAYQTSKWIREVRDRRGIEVIWRFFSLEEINREEGKKHPWERPWSYGWGQMRVGALIRRRHGNDALDRWYEAVGRAFHEEGRPTHEPEVHREVLASVDLDPGLVEEAVADPSTHDDVRADHDHVVSTHGGFGVPVLVFPSGHALFGPVVVPAPTGDAAERLWDLTVGWTEFPHLYELRKPKTADDHAHIAGWFAPYLKARAWRTIENPAP